MQRRKEFNALKKARAKEFRLLHKESYKKQSKLLTGNKKEKSAARKELKNRLKSKLKGLLSMGTATKKSENELGTMINAIKKLKW